MSNKKAGPLFGMGSMILLTVLLVLCLTLFAVLTLSSAQADWRLSEKNARAVSAYYDADTQAVRLMTDAAALWPTGQQRPDADEVFNALSADYAMDAVWSVDDEQKQGLLLYSDMPVEGNRILRLELYLAPPSQSRRWKVNQWQLMSHSPVEEFWEEPFLPVWQGE